MRSMHMENNPLQQEAGKRQISLIDLFTAIAFVMPIVATVGGVKHSSGTLIQYLVTLPLGIMAGALIVAVEWKVAKIIWRHYENRSEKIKNAVGLGLFVILLFWIFVGLVSGDKLAIFVVGHFGR